MLKNDVITGRCRHLKIVGNSGIGVRSNDHNCESFDHAKFSKTEGVGTDFNIMSRNTHSLPNANTITRNNLNALGDPDSSIRQSNSIVTTMYHLTHNSHLRARKDHEKLQHTRMLERVQSEERGLYAPLHKGNPLSNIFSLWNRWDLGNYSEVLTTELSNVFFLWDRMERGNYKEILPKEQSQADLDLRSRFNYYPLRKHHFTIPGYGTPGNDCGAYDKKRVSAFSMDKRKVRINRAYCKRVECPYCYRKWIKHRAFEMTLALETVAYLRGERPFSVVYSVRPADMYFQNWTWNNVNQSLFVRGYRRGKDVGIDGGYAVLHPFRIKENVKKNLREYRNTKSGKERAMLEGNGGFWKMIRSDVLGYGNLYDYVKDGRHLHGLCFGKPKAHSDPNFLIQVQPEIRDGRKTNRPLRLMKTEDVVGKIMYQLTHAGISTLRKTIHPTRRFGAMRDYVIDLGTGLRLDESGEVVHRLFDVRKLPKEMADKLYDPEWKLNFETEWLPTKAREIADLIDMTWSEDRGLAPQTNKNDDDVVWIPIHRLLYEIDDIKNEAGGQYPWEMAEFYQKCYDFYVKYGKPPPLLPDNLDNSPVYWASGYFQGVVVPDCIEVIVDIEETPSQDRQQADTCGITLMEAHLDHLNDPDPGVRLAVNSYSGSRFTRITTGGDGNLDDRHLLMLPDDVLDILDRVDREDNVSEKSMILIPDVVDDVNDKHDVNDIINIDESGKSASGKRVSSSKSERKGDNHE